MNYPFVLRYQPSPCFLCFNLIGGVEMNELKKQPVIKFDKYVKNYNIMGHIYPTVKALRQLDAC